jgi:hypothetical protein
MRKQKVLAKDFQFYFPDLDNIILVESHEDESVTVRASKNNMPEERKIFFIRKLAAEGFISDEYQWFSGSTDGTNGVLWIKDYSWLKTHAPSNRRANRVIGSFLVAACVLWVAMMRIVLVSHSNNTAEKFPSKSSAIVAMANPSATSATPTTSKSFAP